MYMYEKTPDIFANSSQRLNAITNQPTTERHHQPSPPQADRGIPFQTDHIMPDRASSLESRLTMYIAGTSPSSSSPFPPADTISTCSL
jgi:hypothetical protein